MSKYSLRVLPVVAALAALALAGGASAQTAAMEARIREISFGDDGRTRVTVSVSGSTLTGQALTSQNFTVTEGGRPVQGLQVEDLLGSGGRSIVVALVMDTSGSTRGAPLIAARTAARNFVSQLPPGVRVGLISFSDSPTERADLTNDRAPVESGIDGLASGGRTALYDAVVAASRMVGRAANAQRNIVVFSDGNDSISRANLDDAVRAVRNADAQVTTVVLATSGVDEGALRSISEAERGGRLLRVQDTARLTATFSRVAQALSSQYVLSYPSEATQPSELNIGVTVEVGGVTAEDSSVVFNERRAGTAGGPEPQRPLVGLFSGSIGLYLGVVAAFAALALLIGMLLYRPEGRRAERMLARGLRLYSRSDRKKERENSGEGMMSTAVGRRAVDLVERVPRSKKFDEKMQAQLDRAGWPMRSTEFVVLQLLGSVVGAVLGFGLFQRAWLGLILMVVGALAPQLVLNQRMNKRESDFLSQLPDTLQLLAGSLQAGYGFLQAIDTVAKEAAPPTSTEFARVLSEARLGMPLEQALDDMAERVGGEDFKWVVLAINIQRQVGGNLATLLQTVANTLREREQVRRQIKVLSAEGRMSAVILVVLPFALAGYIQLVNPDYIGELTGATIGRIMIAVALVLTGIGIVWMRKIIKIDV